MGFSEQLQEKSRIWVKQGLISDEQRTSIIALHPAEKLWYKNTGFLLRSIALAMLGIALILIISANWDTLPRMARSSIGLFPMITSAFLAWVFYHRNNQSYLELSLFFLAVCLGVNIGLQAQIYHVSGFYPDAMLWWMIGILPPLLWLKSRPLNYLLLIIFFIHSGLMIDVEQFTLISSVLLIISLWVWVTNPSAPGLFLWSIAMGWHLGHFLFWENDSFSIPVYWLAGAITFQQFYTFVERKLIPGRIFTLLSGASGWSVILLWFILTFKESKNFFHHGEITLSLILFSSIAFILFIIQRFSVKKAFHDSIAGFAVIFLILYLTTKDMNNLLWVTIVFNIGFLIAAIFQLANGIANRDKEDFFSGVTMVIALAFARYTDLVDDYITSALLFAACGALLWYLNRYWEKRYGT